METLEERLAAVEAEFELAGDWNDRYRLMVEWGTELAVLPEDQRTEACAVSGCSSPLWLAAWVEDGRLRVAGYTPGIVPLALLALLTRLYDGLDADSAPQEVSHRLQLDRHLSPVRELVFRRLLAIINPVLESLRA